MRKLALVVIFIVFIISVFFNMSKEKEIRVRIIPNSNNISDLEEKDEVKDIIICYLNNIYDEDYDIYFNNISATYKELENVLNDKYNNISISFDKHTLYNKAYNDIEVKNEEAYTLYVVIGSGSGNNWWSSIYPKFLVIGGDEVIKYESLLYNVFKIIKEK